MYVELNLISKCGKYDLPIDFSKYLYVFEYQRNVIIFNIYIIYTKRYEIRNISWYISLWEIQTFR